MNFDTARQFVERFDGAYPESREDLQGKIQSLQAEVVALNQNLEKMQGGLSNPSVDTETIAKQIDEVKKNVESRLNLILVYEDKLRKLESVIAG